MRELMRRVEKLEQHLSEEASGPCACGGSMLVHYYGDPEPEPKNCPRHGLQRVLQVVHVSPSAALDS
jgi:hypothetical protein